MMQEVQRKQEQSRKSYKEIFNTPQAKSTDIMAAIGKQKYLSIPKFGSMNCSFENFKFPVEKSKSAIRRFSYISNQNAKNFNRRCSAISINSGFGLSTKKQSIEEIFMKTLKKSSSREIFANSTPSNFNKSVDFGNYHRKYLFTIFSKYALLHTSNPFAKIVIESYKSPILS